MVSEGNNVICNCVDGGQEVQYPKIGTEALLMGILVEEVAITMSCHCVKRQDPPFLTNYWAIRRGPSKESWPYQHGNFLILTYSYEYSMYCSEIENVIPL
ncbi:Hypothetical predicted protein [Olea europaea subsp. europaea]|uniref:Uncharacterized protein n=1 Tax=Olea europaea subsp. europaea TaxID=158383 RepID=A0A8S0QC74_OLEEU|nr:Hypothetical predicted protein [Olea europaea subsp. europaea]